MSGPITPAKAIYLVDDESAVAFGRRIGIREAYVYGDVLQGKVHIPKPECGVIVCSTAHALAKARELTSSGISESGLAFVDLELPFESLTLDRLRWLLKNYMTIIHDRVRPIEDWADDLPWTPWWTGDDAFDSFLRWRPRTIAVIAGDEGCGKSMLSQTLGLKLLTGSTLRDSKAKISVCAWEDDRAVFRQRVRSFGLEGTGRVHWFDPDADHTRSLEQYLKDIRILTLAKDVRIHICDPWNAFSHSFDGDTETQYVARMLMAFEQLTCELGVTVIIVAHLPKDKERRRGWRPFGIADVAGSKNFANKADIGLCVAHATFLSEMLTMEDDELRPYRITSDDVKRAQANAKRNVFEGSRHMIVALDKVKVWGMRDRGMGVHGSVRAFVYNPETCELKLDPLATELAAAIW